MPMDPKKIAAMLVVGKKDDASDESDSEDAGSDGEDCTEGQKAAAEEFLAATHDHDPEGVVSSLKSLLALLDDDSGDADKSDD